MLTRRELLAGLAAFQTRPAPGKGQRYSGEARRFADPLTEREVWRLTPLTAPHRLPESHQRYLARNNSFLLLGSERDGQPQILRMELMPGRPQQLSVRLEQLTEGAGVVTRSLCLAPDERSFFFLQNGVLKQMGLRRFQEREIFRVEAGWTATGDMGISIDGRYAALVEMKSEDRVAGEGDEAILAQFERRPLCRIRVVETAKGAAWVVVEERAWLGRPQLRPKRDQILYCHEGPWDRVATRIWLVNLDGKQRQSVRGRQGEERLGHEYWTADGKLVAFVHYLDAAGRRSTVRTLNPDTREEQTLARCTQFWRLSGNADHSAIVGASRSKAGPNIYVLFPVTQRETTLCEHAARAVESDPAFSGDSQWVYFTSDREGTPAVYRAAVADLVEKT